jgi:hypothetical protein
VTRDSDLTGADPGHPSPPACRSTRSHDFRVTRAPAPACRSSHDFRDGRKVLPVARAQATDAVARPRLSRSLSGQPEPVCERRTRPGGPADSGGRWKTSDACARFAGVSAPGRAPPVTEPAREPRRRRLVRAWAGQPGRLSIADLDSESRAETVTVTRAVRDAARRRGPGRVNWKSDSAPALCRQRHRPDMRGLDVGFPACHAQR